MSWFAASEPSRDDRKAKRSSKLSGKVRAKDATKTIDTVRNFLENATDIWNPLDKDTEFLRRGLVLQHILDLTQLLDPLSTWSDSG